MPVVEPFIRWAGGKSWSIKSIDQILGELNYKNYYEPFLGGASVFFAIEPPNQSYLSDSNEDLINTYVAVRDSPHEVISIFLTYENTMESYYEIRKRTPSDLVERAARFIFLNQTSYNGLYRVNKKGLYNVPYGYRKNWAYDCDRILKASEKLQNVKLQCNDFELNKYLIRKRDLIFLDPPYTVTHNNNGFIEYNKDLFSLEDQYRLSKYIDYIKKNGAYYILTNAAHPVIKEIFYRSGDRLLELDRQSLIGGKKAKRGKVSEYIFTNIPEEV